MCMKVGTKNSFKQNLLFEIEKRNWMRCVSVIHTAVIFSLYYLIKRNTAVVFSTFVTFRRRSFVMIVNSLFGS